MGQLRTCWRSQNRLTLWARRDGLVRCLGWGWRTLDNSRYAAGEPALPPKGRVVGAPVCQAVHAPPASCPQLRDLTARGIAGVPLPAPPAVALFAARRSPAREWLRAAPLLMAGTPPSRPGDLCWRWLPGRRNRDALSRLPADSERVAAVEAVRAGARISSCSGPAEVITG